MTYSPVDLGWRKVYPGREAFDRLTAGQGIVSWRRSTVEFLSDVTSLVEGTRKVKRPWSMGGIVRIMSTQLNPMSLCDLHRPGGEAVQHSV